MSNNYTDEQILYFLANGGKFFKANNQLFIVEQTGLIIGPINVENAAFFVNRNSNQEITMSGENFKNPLKIVSSDAGISISGISVDSRSQISFTITADDSGIPKGGKSLTYKTREGLDGSEATIENNIVVLPKAPSMSSVTLDNARSFLEVGCGLDESEHAAGLGYQIAGSEFYDLQDVEDALQSGATLAGIGLTAPAGKDHKVRVGKLLNGQWIDDPDVTVTSSVVDEFSISVTLVIDSDFSIDDLVDTRTMDVVVETYSGDLGSAHAGSNFARTSGDNTHVGNYAIMVDSLTVRRARPNAFVEVVMMSSSTSLDPTAGTFDDDLAAAKAAGVDIPLSIASQQAITDPAQKFKQQDVKKFYFRCESAHMIANGGDHDAPACIDSSAKLVQLAGQSSTLPAGGNLHAAQVGGAAPASGWITSGSGLQELQVLSETEFMITLDARDDQEIGTYGFALTTDSSEDDTSICQFQLDLDQGVLVVTTIDLTILSPDALEVYAAGQAAGTLVGDLLPQGYSASLDAQGNLVELQDGVARTAANNEGKISLSASASEIAGPALVFDNIAVSDDENASFTVEADAADILAHIAAGGTAEEFLGNFNVSVQLEDAEGNQQNPSVSHTFRVMHEWPPLLQTGTAPWANYANTGENPNLLREGSMADAQGTVDTLMFKVIRLRGDHQPGGQLQYPAINGVSAAIEFGETEVELFLKAGVDDYKIISSQVEADLVADADVGTGLDKPFIMIDAIRASKTGLTANDAQGVEHECYRWELDCRVATEENMEKTLAAPNGLEDVCMDANYANLSVSPLGIRVRRKLDTDDFTDWEYYEDLFEIMPADIEVDADAYEVARAQSESASMTGDNFSPAGAGSFEGASGGSSSGGSSSGGSSSSGSSSSGGGNTVLASSVPYAQDPSSGVATITMTQSDAQAIIDAASNGVNVTSPGGGGYSAYASAFDLSATANGLEIANAFSPIWEDELGPTVDVVLA